MSEVLASLKQKGGGSGGVDLSLPPDVSYTNANMANDATYSISVTQKPRYVVVTYSIRTSAGSYLYGIVNVETGVGYRYGYWSSAFRNEVWANYDTYITSITDTAVVVKNSYGGPCYVSVGIYY